MEIRETLCAADMKCLALSGAPSRARRRLSRPGCGESTSGGSRCSCPAEARTPCGCSAELRFYSAFPMIPASGRQARECHMSIWSQISDAYGRLMDTFIGAAPQLSDTPATQSEMDSFDSSVTAQPDNYHDEAGGSSLPDKDDSGSSDSSGGSDGDSTGQPGSSNSGGGASTSGTANSGSTSSESTSSSSASASSPASPQDAAPSDASGPSSEPANSTSSSDGTGSSGSDSSSAHSDSSSSGDSGSGSWEGGYDPSDPYS
jgi:hypothetical protein